MRGRWNVSQLNTRGWLAGLRRICWWARARGCDWQHDVFIPRTYTGFADISLGTSCICFSVIPDHFFAAHLHSSRCRWPTLPRTPPHTRDNNSRVDVGGKEIKYSIGGDEIWRGWGTQTYIESPKMSDLNRRFAAVLALRSRNEREGGNCRLRVRTDEIEKRLEVKIAVRNK